MARSRTLRWYHITGIVVGGLLLLGGVTVYLYFQVMSAWDEPPPDDADLLPQREAVPDEENALTTYMEAMAILEWPGYEPPQEQAAAESEADADVPARETLSPEDVQAMIAEAERAEAQVPKQIREEREALREKADRLSQMADGEAWDAALAGEVLEANRDTFRLIEAARSRSTLQLPAVTQIDTSIPWAYTLMTVGDLVRLRARQRFRRGEEAAAFEEAVAWNNEELEFPEGEAPPPIALPDPCVRIRF